MKNLYKNFISGMYWNTLESILYQSILILHFIFLFRTISNSLYGLTSMMFALLYLSIDFINLGLEAGISPFFTFFSKSKKHFKKLFFMQILPQFVLFLTIPILFYIFREQLLHFFPKNPFLLEQINSTILIIYGLSITFEGSKKILRNILQLAFLNKKTMFAEIFFIIFYTSLLWSTFLLTKTINLYVIFIPFLISSIFSSIILAMNTYFFYKTLPCHSYYNPPPNLNLRIFKSRIFNYFNKISNSLFSSNFLMPFLASRFGLAKVGILQIISEIIYFIVSSIRKIFGLTGNAYLANIKEAPLSEKQKVFANLTARLYQFLYFIFIFLIINYKKIYNPSIINNWPVTYFFIITSFFENFFLLYEKFYITEEKSEHLFFLSIINILSIYLIIKFSSYFSDIYLFALIILIRVFVFTLISSISYKKWNIKPHLKMQIKYFLFSLFISLFFLLIF